MQLPVMPPVKPMLAKAVKDVPDQPAEGPAWLYEPKWDGFRCLVFRDGDEVEIGSRNEKPLTRYFPELVAAVRAELPERCVLDGEIVIAREAGGSDRLDWEALSQRIHPAESRIAKLAEETPAMIVFFDALALGDEDLTELPLGTRRERLVAALAGGGTSCHVTAATDDPELARDWFRTFEGAGLDGVMAKPLEVTYQPDKRALQKVKHHREADCVVIGYRPHKSLENSIGSMLLGLYDESGEDEGWTESVWGEAGAGLRMVGGASAFTQVRRRELMDELQEYRIGDAVSPGMPNRWNARIDHSWVPLRPELVCEVAYDQMEGSRFRHAARFTRWRPDRDPRSCGYSQLEVPAKYDLGKVLETR